MTRWWLIILLCSIYTAAVSINGVQYLKMLRTLLVLSRLHFDSKQYSSFLCILLLYNYYICKITTMRYSKHELNTINMSYFLSKICHITPDLYIFTAATFFCPQVGRCGEVRLYFNSVLNYLMWKRLGWPCVRLQPLYLWQLYYMRITLKAKKVNTVPVGCKWESLAHAPLKRHPKNNLNWPLTNSQIVIPN